jgi:hypothetical protein
MAVIEMGLGNKDQTLKWLNQAYSARSVNLVYLKVKPIFDGLALTLDSRNSCVASDCHLTLDK